MWKTEQAYAQSTAMSILHACMSCVWLALLHGCMHEVSKSNGMRGVRSCGMHCGMFGLQVLLLMCAAFGVGMPTAG